MMTKSLGGGHSLPLLYHNNSNKQLRPQNKLYIRHPVIKLLAAKNRVLPLITNNSPSVQEKGNATMKNFLHLALCASGCIAFKNEFHMHLKAINPINIFFFGFLSVWVSFLTSRPCCHVGNFLKGFQEPSNGRQCGSEIKECKLFTQYWGLIIQFIYYLTAVILDGICFLFYQQRSYILTWEMCEVWLLYL